jgi:hypothetical protein
VLFAPDHNGCIRLDPSEIFGTTPVPAFLGCAMHLSGSGKRNVYRCSFSSSFSWFFPP